jgi:hypothetical protein
MAQVYVAKPERVHADPYAAATMPGAVYPTAYPWVCTCTNDPMLAGPHLHGRDGPQALTDGDWIVALVVNPLKYWAMTAAEFSEVYGPGGGPAEGG